MHPFAKILRLYKTEVLIWVSLFSCQLSLDGRSSRGRCFLVDSFQNTRPEGAKTIMTPNFFVQTVRSVEAWQILRIGVNITGWIVGSCLFAELLGYWLHRLLHSGAIPFLSRSHMTHHLVLYGPQQKQRSSVYLDATEDRVSLTNIGIEWLVPAACLIVSVVTLFWLLHVPLSYQLLSLTTMFVWSFSMFSFLHDAMHVEGFWMERKRWLKRWFLSARRLHDIHHRSLSHYGLMNKNFGIGFFFFDRIFGTFSADQEPFNAHGYAVAKKTFKHLETR